MTVLNAYATDLQVAAGMVADALYMSSKGGTAGVIKGMLAGHQQALS